MKKNKSLFIFGISILFIFLWLSCISFMSLPVEMRSCIKDSFFEIFNWKYFYTLFLFLWGFVFIFLSFFVESMPKETRIVLIISLPIFLLPFYIDIISMIFGYEYYYYSPASLMGYLVITFFYLKNLIGLKKENFKKISDIQNHKPILLFRLLTLFIIITSIFSIHKFILVLNNYKYILPKELYSKIEPEMTREDILKIAGKPFFYIQFYENLKGEKLLVFLKNEKVYKVFPKIILQKELTINNIKTRFGNPIFETLIYSYTPFGSSINSRNISLKNGRYYLF